MPQYQIKANIHSLLRYLRSIKKYLRDGKITPLRPRTVYDASAAESAFRYLQEEGNNGRTLLVLKDEGGHTNVGNALVRPVDVFAADPSASYLLAGGLGGIASVIARYLVERGARRLVCLSRNPGSRPEDADKIKELESMGCEIVLVKGSLTSKEDIASAVKQAPMLRGVIHCPMLLQDESFRNMSVDQWNAASDPKVKGAWYLHEATRDVKLDFFVFLSSMSGLNGQPGQANYAGANTFLDAFAQYRNGQGLAASSIDIGAVADMGYAARDDALLQRLIKNGYSGVTESEMVEAFTAAATFPAAAAPPTRRSYVHHNTFATGFGSTVSLSNPESRSWWKKDRRMAAWHNIYEGDDKENDDSGLKTFLAGAKSNADTLRKPETQSYIAREIGKQLMNLLLKPEDELDVSLPVAQLGLDSLVGIELRSWWRQVFGLDISVLQLLGLGTLEELSKQAVDGLLKQLEG